MNGGNLISIIIPVYNKQDTIANTIQSIFDQSYQNFEIVVVNDGSTDNSSEIVSSFYDPRIRLINQLNAGVSAARNNGIRKAKGELIAFIDADDEWHREYLSRQIELIGNYPGCQVFATNYKFKYADGHYADTIINKIPFTTDTGILSNYFEVASISNCPIWTSAVIIRREALIEAGGFPIGITSGEDLLTWAKLACRFNIAYDRRAWAHYILPITSSERNKIGRPHDKHDTVGKELAKLYINNKHVNGLKKYVAFWHKMRASVSLKSNRISNAMHEGMTSIKFNFFNPKAFAIIALCLTPRPLRNYLISKIN